MCKGFVVLVLLVSAFILPAPKAKAIDPVTLAILAPVAIKVAKEASPYIITGLKNGAVGMMQVGKDMLEIFYLPWGVTQATLGLPFGGLAPGIKNVVVGSIAPFKMTFHTLMLPLYFCGISVR